MTQQLASLFTTDIGRLRLLSFLEGVSYLGLIGIGMPLKYFAEDPSIVHILGRVHGGFFVLFLLALAQAAATHSWRWTRVVLAVMAAMVPLGAFFLERQLRSLAIDAVTRNKPEPS